MNVIVGITTIPSRVNRCKSTIHSLLNQKTLFDYKIEINIPKFFKRFNDTIETIPKFMEHPKIKINRTDDYGCITKLIPCLKNHNEYDDIIVNCDDDIIYPENWLSSLINQQVFTSGAVVCLRGRSFKSDHIVYENTKIVQYNSVQSKTKTNILTATWGVAYPRMCFGEDFFNIPLDTEVFFSDDSYISGYLASKKIPIYVVPFNGKISSTAISTLEALWSINRVSQNNNKTLALFKDSFIEDINNGQKTRSGN